MAGRRPTDRDFRLARLARERYGLADLTLGPDLATARTIAARLAARRAGTPAEGTPEGLPSEGAPPEGAPAASTGVPQPGATKRTVTPGELQAAGILVAILGRLIDRYRAGAEPDALHLAGDEVTAELGPAGLDATLAAFPLEFPRHLEQPEPIEPENALAQLVLLGVLSDNPAIAPFGELVDLRPLRDRAAAAPDVEAALASTLDERPAFPGDARSLIELLREPAAAAPDSLADQLRYIRSAWGKRFGDLLDDLFEQLLVALDVLAEERHAAELAWLGAQPDAGAGGPSEVYTFEGEAAESERFSADLDWMPRIVLVAKSTYVWLDQLSRRYGRAIRTLDAIPDEELDDPRRAGHHRPVADRPVGAQPGVGQDQAASRPDRGGRLGLLARRLRDRRRPRRAGALDNLRARAAGHGIRLASDMVPNHMGIDSRWVIEHPDRFLSLAEPPFPAYSFSGPDLSADERVAIRIEDHYYDATDAAVVFKRVDRATGDVRYVYHGNDGTSFPWNDTAQLDYSKAEVREAVIRTILAVARHFPIIRFDAAMVLVKRHIQRLWFPEPGAGGAIPSRAGQGMSRRAFEALMPDEFWREVVDRVALEAPETLLLAEAFWLLEGYFVRTLGMHRVYNSAFMNMLRDENNAGYRMVMKNTLEFDPAILGRFVNFMSNPDEKTALEQFGTGDKYFGVAALLATLPGLPLLGHGQVEGFREQYGMEFRRARLDEAVDTGLLAHHERTIFPLLRRRAEFAGPDGFRLYDFETGPGQVNEDVFAYSNRGPAGERSLVLFHNRYAETTGRARMSSTYARRDAEGNKEPARATIAAGLGIEVGPHRWLVLRDAMTGLEELRSTTEVAADGFQASLEAYGCRVYVDLREVVDAPGAPWSRLAAKLAGRPVPNVADSLAELILEPEHEARRAEISTILAGLGPAATDARRLAAVGRALAGVDLAGLRLESVIRAVLAQSGLPEADLDRSVGIVRALSAARPDLVGLDPAAVRAWFADPAIRAALRVNAWQGVEYVEREAWASWLAVIAEAADAPRSRRRSALARAAARAGYRVDGILGQGSSYRHPSPTGR